MSRKESDKDQLRRCAVRYFRFIVVAVTIRHEDALVSALSLTRY